MKTLKNCINTFFAVIGFTVLLNAQYTEIWNSTGSMYIGTQNTDSDSPKEVIFTWWDLSSWKYHILIIDGATGNIDWDSGPWDRIYEYEYSTTGSFHPQLIDIDSDGIYEILFRGNQLEGDEEKWHLYSSKSGIGKVNGDYLPTNPKLFQNYPNPFNPSTTIEYSLEKTGDVKIQIFNVKGQLVETLVDNYKNPGSYSLNWSPTSFSSGQYFYQIIVDGQAISTKKAIFLK